MSIDTRTYKDIYCGDSRRRIHALFTLALWFAIGGFLFSILGDYVSALDSIVANIGGGIFVALTVASTKVKVSSTGR